MAEDLTLENGLTYAECTIDNVSGWEITGFGRASTEIVIPDEIDGKSVLSVGCKAFQNLSALTKVTFPKNLQTIGDHAFSGCTSLGELSFPASLTTIGEGAFYDCDILEKVSFAANSQPFTIGLSCFSYCRALKEVLFPEGCKPTSIGSGAFRYCAISSIDLPDTITRLGEAAFDECAALDGTVVIPRGVTTLSSYLFHNCVLLDQVVLHDQITHIDNAFIGCESLTGSFVIPEGQTRIESETFQNCKKITSVSIPDSVTEIRSYAFENCAGLTELTLPAGLTDVGRSSFDGCTNLAVLRLKGTRLFGGMFSAAAKVEHLQRAIYPANAAPDLAMNNFGESLVGMEDQFAEAYPDGYADFYSWTSSNSDVATVKDGIVTTKKPGDVDVTFVYNGCSHIFRLKFIQVKNMLVLPESLQAIHEEAFTSTDAQQVVIPSVCTAIGSDAFRDMDKLMFVSVPDSVTEIEEGAFADCPNLTLLCQSMNAAAEYAQTHGIPWMIG